MSEKINVSQPAPLFVADTVYGEPFDLAAKKGQTILLAFHRYAACPVCNFSLRQFGSRHQELLNQGITYVPVFHSTVEKMREYYPEQPPFEIIADPQMKLYKLYGLKPSITAFLHPKAIRDGIGALKTIMRPDYDFKLSPDNTMLTRPADFLIDAGGIVRHAYYGVSLGDSLTVDQILNLAPA